jgi:hypothetical protein
VSAVGLLDGRRDCYSRATPNSRRSTRSLTPDAHPRPANASARTEHGHPARTLTELLADLATLCRNRLRIGDADHTFACLSEPTKFPPAALGLLDVKLGT